MAKGQIDYGRMVEQALRTVVRDVLRHFAGDGLPSPHHFYITFRTTDPGVEIPPYLRERYPTEMTIVLQYQYWDLKVSDEGFEVTLSFNDVPQHLVIPFTALKVFADPGAEFGLQFTIEPEVVAMAQSEGEVARIQALPRPAAGDAAATEDVAEEGDAKIVTLDRFRKK